MRAIDIEQVEAVVSRAGGLLQCPRHGATLTGTGGGLSCAACGWAVVADHDDILRLSAPPSAVRGSRAMDLMRSAALVRIYERLWRPTLIRLISRLDYRMEDAFIDRHVRRKPGLRVLELCCGTARATRRLLGDDAEALGVDLSLSMLREARRAADRRLVLLEADVAQAVARKGTFDLALCLAALHLLDDVPGALRHARQALRPGGVFVGWALTETGLLGRLSRVARGLGVRPFPVGGLARAVADVGLVPGEVLRDGAIELMAATAPP